MVLPEIDHGYRIVWIVKKNKLYIKELNAYRLSYGGYNPSKKEKRLRLEKYLGRKFEKNGIFADFVTGKFILYKYRDFFKKTGDKYDKYTSEEKDAYEINLIDKQEIYTIEFKDGVLIRLFQENGYEEKYREWKKHIYGITN